MDVAARRSVPDSWIASVFSAQAVAKGGVVRRWRRWVEREIGMDRFVAEVRRRGFHMVECGGQLIVICNPHGLRVIC
ncbi:MULTISPECIES: N-(5'-phosphoribosyl)anthranilate isomerase [Rhodovulum]|uniref:N-(5'-phosphoribosyl)anthranilate isomerase n=2 Tax=Rhodovulum TaxID=34008 RepID=A0A8E3AP91_9RHOB|nr:MULTISPECIES: N-(5'-phosphoribosyl)anthranilate isomerase [Rhodovulum]PTW41655.1 hypothetical protein C8N38_1234 [Rhodovulum kholense]RAP39829.1 N-(5'-phosphoribosyl)anthranilate isomerase [Rhodovulum viride]